MSGVAGNMAVTMGSYYLARPSGGKGMLLGNVLGRAYGKVVVVGGGVVGLHAANVAAGMGAQLVIFGRHPEREATLQQEITPTLRYLRSEPDGVAEQLQDADLVHRRRADSRRQSTTCGERRGMSLVCRLLPLPRPLAGSSRTGSG
jgi:alanine dehydrogenase